MHRIDSEEIERYKNATYKIRVGNIKQGIFIEEAASNVIKDSLTKYTQRNIIEVPIFKDTIVNVMQLMMADENSDEYHQIGERIFPTLYLQDLDRLNITWTLVIEESGAAISIGL